jgi:hypothetical protein
MVRITNAFTSMGFIIGSAAVGVLGVTLFAFAASLPPGAKRTDAKIEGKLVRMPKGTSGTLTAPTLKSLAASHATDVHPYVAIPDSDDTHTITIRSKKAN